MEIRKYFLLARKWAWLILIGAIIGAVGGYVYGSRQPIIYRTTTKIMVSHAMEQDSSGYYFWNELQLAKTYSQLINTGPVLEALSKKLGYAVSGSQISVAQVPDSLLLDITVQDRDPQKTADIANNLVDVFVTYNENLQTDRYASSEQTLKAQIAQVETQISVLQSQLVQVSEQTQEIEQEEIQKRAQELQSQMNQTDAEIIKVEGEIAAFFPPSAATATPRGRGWPTATSYPTPTLSPEESIQVKQLQSRLDQLQTLSNLYKDTYANMLVLGDQKGDNQNLTSNQNQVQSALALYQQIYSNLLNNYEAIRLARLRSTPNIVQIEKAKVPSSPIQIDPLSSGAIGAVAVAVLMCGIAFAIEYLDDTLKTPEDVDRYLHLPVIGLIGEMENMKGKEKNSYVYVAENPLSPITEAFRTLRANLDFAGVDKPLQTLLITSTSPSEGKSTLAVNLAVVMAQGERKVVLLDTDLRRPSVHRYLQIANRRGLSDLFRDPIKLPEAISAWGTPEFEVIPSGGLPPNPAELLGSKRMLQIIEELKQRSDIIILDAPPCIISDPVILSARVDGVLLVVEPGKTKIGAAQVALEQLRRADARVVGVVMNPVSHRRGNYYSKYRYYSSYYYSRGYNHYFGTNGDGKSKRNGNGNGKNKAKEDARTDMPVS